MRLSVKITHLGLILIFETGEGPPPAGPPHGSVASGGAACRQALDSGGACGGKTVLPAELTSPQRHRTSTLPSGRLKTANQRPRHWSHFLRRRNHVLSNHVLRHHNHVARHRNHVLRHHKKILRALQLLRIWMVEQGSENAATTDAMTVSAMTAATSAVAREAGCIARGSARARARASPGGGGDHGAKDKNALC